MTIGVHDFEIPHEHVTPTRDMVIIRVPVPPVMLGGTGKLVVPEQFRQLASHNVQAGRIVAMGPIAFQYKDGEGINCQEVGIGDWVIIRPYAGSHIQGGQLKVNTGWRYVSSFADVIGIIPADKMPKPETLLWSEDEAEALLRSAATKAGVDPNALSTKAAMDFNFNNTRSPSPMFAGQQDD